MARSVAVVNASSFVSDVEVAEVAAALAVQLTRDVEPAWGWSAEVIFVAVGTNPPADAWSLEILDVSDREGASGYHDRDADGRPFGRVFVGNGGRLDPDWSISASHELLEMLADPASNHGIVASTDLGLSLYALEICDPCEAAPFAYSIGMVRVSDFVFPAWYEPRSPAGTLLDYTGSVSRPLQLLSGGFISRLDLPGAQWQSVFAGERPGERRRAGPVLRCGNAELRRRPSAVTNH